MHCGLIVAHLQCKHLNLYKEYVEMYKRSLECLKRCRNENVSFEKFLEVSKYMGMMLLYMIDVAAYRMYINYWQRKILKYLKYKVSIWYSITCDMKNIICDHACRLARNDIYSEIYSTITRYSRVVMLYRILLYYLKLLITRLLWH